MKTIPLSELSCYLAYGLNVYYYDAERERKCLCTIEMLHLPDELTITDGMLEYDVNIDDIKPLVIPLDKLTDEQWHEVFNAGLQNAVPALPDDFLKSERSIERHDKAVELCYKAEENNLGYSFDEFMFSSENGIRFNQTLAFQKIFNK